MKIGILALQGDVREHAWAIQNTGNEAVEVKKASQLEGLAGLIVPGGESTTIGKLMEEYGFFSAIKEKAEEGLGIYGTCAGLILLAKEIAGSTQPRLGLMDIVAQRNAYGRQRESFETDLEIPVLGEEPFRSVFIRAPYIEAVGPEVQVLATYDNKIVFARQGRFLASAFHPEETEDLRVHRYFIRILKREV
ncbi:MAG: pyridoxal 5'-phosphate synthase glutaminase subunit PdxT [Firmicutes bacterium]|nr:pyridoxal 5'-phosphate synthase glutaminase subunit PdxT [Bacillota bacterium]